MPNETTGFRRRHEIDGCLPIMWFRRLACRVTHDVQN